MFYSVYIAGSELKLQLEADVAHRNSSCGHLLQISECTLTAALVGAHRWRSIHGDTKTCKQGKYVHPIF